MDFIHDRMLLSAQKGEIDVADSLLSKYDLLNRSASDETWTVRVWLMEAIRHNQFMYVQWMITRCQIDPHLKILPEATSGLNAHGPGSLGYAVEHGFEELAAVLVAAGVSIGLTLGCAAEYKKWQLRRAQTDAETIEIIDTYHRVIRDVLDYASGTDLGDTFFSDQDDVDVSLSAAKSDLSRVFRDVPVVCFNFIGVSIRGHLIDPPLLQDVGAIDVEWALFLPSEVVQVETISRREKIKSYLAQGMAHQKAIRIKNVIHLVPLHWSVRHKDMDMVTRRLSRWTLRDFQQPTFATLFDRCAREKKEPSAMVLLFLNRMKQLPMSNEMVMEWVERALDLCGLDERYLDSFLPIDYVSKKDGQTALTRACKALNLPVVKKLMDDQQAAVEGKNRAGYTPLMVTLSAFWRYQRNHVVRESDVENLIHFLTYFVSKGANVNLQVYEVSVLSLVADIGNVTVLELLLPHIIHPVPSSYDSVLFHPKSYRSECQRLFNLLQKYGADLTRTNDKGNLLHHICHYFHFGDEEEEKEKENLSVFFHAMNWMVQTVKLDPQQRNVYDEVPLELLFRNQSVTSEITILSQVLSFFVDQGYHRLDHMIVSHCFQHEYDSLVWKFLPLLSSKELQRLFNSKKKKQSLLHQACLWSLSLPRAVEILVFLLHQNLFDLQQVDGDGNTPLDYAQAQVMKCRQFQDKLGQFQPERWQADEHRKQTQKYDVAHQQAQRCVDLLGSVGAHARSNGRKCP